MSPAAEKVRQPELLADEPRPSQALASVEPITMFERLGADPNVSVDKLERLIAMQERIMDREAESAFNQDFTLMALEIPTIGEKAKTDKTTYAPLEDIIDVIRPICARFGFSLGFQTEWPTEKTVKVIGILTHKQGHARRSEFLSAADQTGSKNAIQALASTVSYGKRYTTKDLLCIVTRKEDDDGAKSEKAKQPDSPKGYDDWLTDMQSAADEGWEAMAKAWDASPIPLRAHLTETAPGTLKAMKAKAKAATAKAAQS